MRAGRGVGFLAALWLLAVNQIATGQVPSSSAMLVQRGLTFHHGAWLCSEEVLLRRNLAELSRLERTFYASREQYQNAVKQYEAARAQIKHLKAQLVQARKSASGQSESLRKSRDETIKNLEKTIAEKLSAFAENSPFARSIVSFINAQNSLALVLLEIERKIDALPAGYEPLLADDRLQANLRQHAWQLGPIENYAASQKRKLKRLGDEVFADGVPVYRRSGQIRVSLILCETAPGTFSVDDQPGPVLLTASMLQLAEIDVARNAPTHIIRWHDRAIATRSVTVPTLRLGKYVFRNVSALALPPEAEDLGARISVATFAGYSTIVDEHRYWLQVSESK